jgi:glyoxylase-like metal-dependent hydrolase (beta-lactamase superfamily II)
MNKTTFVALVLTPLFAAATIAPALAQTAATPPVGPDWSKAEVKTIDLGHRTYMLSNGISGNVTIAVGDDGIIMVDGQHAPMHDKLKEAIAKISPQPIKFLVNTHLHGDHTGGKVAFGKGGVIIVAHENVKKRLAAGSVSNLSGAQNPPVPAEGLPSRTYEGGSITLEVKGRSAKLTHFARAHTDGDTYIYFADANVLSTGDTFNNGRYQNSDWVNGGNLAGMIAVADVYLSIGNDQTKIVPGHGPLATKAQLKDFRDMMQASLTRMKTLIATGDIKSEADAIAAKPFDDLDNQWAANEQSARNWIRIVYNSAKM